MVTVRAGGNPKRRRARIRTYSEKPTSPVTRTMVRRSRRVPAGDLRGSSTPPETRSTKMTRAGQARAAASARRERGATMFSWRTSKRPARSRPPAHGLAASRLMGSQPAPSACSAEATAGWTGSPPKTVRRWPRLAASRAKHTSLPSPVPSLRGLKLERYPMRSPDGFTRCPRSLPLPDGYAWVGSCRRPRSQE